MKRIMREIVRHYNYIDKHANGTGGSNVLILSCGHELVRKFSEGIPKKVWCRECQSWANGTTSYSQIGDVIETWDSKTQMPVRTTVLPQPRPSGRKDE